ncbi:MAG: type II toxin-antitoxin system VapC family toxin [Methyloprofundus sp.]|nr:type II toxin-antitoxin system VapC family toxin [Methyloprofundus sp.]
MYLLDTNACIRLMNQSSSNIIKHIQKHPPAEIALCSIVKAELLYGARHSQRVEANLQLLQRFFKPLTSLNFDDRCADEAGQIRADLAAQGKPIGPNDVLIAATARAYDAVLITHNTGEFSRVTGLRLEDWEIQ